MAIIDSVRDGKEQVQLNFQKAIREEKIPEGLPCKIRVRQWPCGQLELVCVKEVIINEVPPVPVSPTITDSTPLPPIVNAPDIKLSKLASQLMKKLANSPLAV